MSFIGAPGFGAGSNWRNPREGFEEKPERKTECGVIETDELQREYLARGFSPLYVVETPLYTLAFKETGGALCRQVGLIL